mmetsp:Transcript_4936/g.10431  ORF Transcript_4936/g.10431 Transcript_4936/m.10431 type:complete len:310 (-) Transcript_4936:268-1197(-)
MKVFICYNEHSDTSLQKTLKITLPKSWKSGPTSKLVEFFCESYNSDPKLSADPLDPSALRLFLLPDSTSSDPAPLAAAVAAPVGTVLASDATVSDVIPDRSRLSVRSGSAPTLAALAAEAAESERAAAEAAEIEARETAVCVNLGCGRRFKRGECQKCMHHKAPPVFHETAKFWSCCSHKKAYDWDDFRSIPGCVEAVCTDVKGTGEDKQFLGGCDLREKQSGPKLKSIDDFNKGALEQLRGALEEVGVEGTLFDQVATGIKGGWRGDNGDSSIGATGEEDEEGYVVRIIGAELKRAMKEVAVRQLRIS